MPRSRNAFLLGAGPIAVLGALTTRAQAAPSMKGDGGVMLINGRF